MSGLLRRAGEEQGQSMVFFVVLMTGFVLMVALVVDVGMWLQARRSTQVVADAAALAGAQALQSSASPTDAVSEYRRLNSSTTNVTIGPSGADSVHVTASRELPGLFSRLAEVAGVTANAQATARVGPPGVLSNDRLQGLGDVVITPLVIDESDACAGAEPVCLGTEHTFVLGRELGMMCPGTCSTSRLAGWFSCPRQCLGGSFGSAGGTVDVPGAGRRAVRGPVSRAVQSLDGRTVIVPLVAATGGSTYHIDGFGALVVTGVTWPRNTGNGDPDPDRWIRGYFTTYRAPGALTTSGGAVNYGVSVVGLTT
jgi:Flp pilus assembly protein TadG